MSIDSLLRRELVLPHRETPMSAEDLSARAFIERLFAEHHAEIYGYLARMVRDEDLAADLAQETFVKAYRALDTLEDPERARSWLYAIASRTALDELRRRRVIRFVPWTGESRGVAPSAEDAALRGALSGEMARALARIPDRQRSALILAEIQDLSGVELAVALGVSHVAARALLTRARESMRKALAEEQAASRAAPTGGAPGKASTRARGPADESTPQRIEERR